MKYNENDKGLKINIDKITVDPRLFENKPIRRTDHYVLENMSDDIRNIPEMASKIFVKGHALKQIWKDQNKIDLFDTKRNPYPVDYISFTGYKVDKLIQILEKFRDENVSIETVLLDIKTKEEFPLVGELMHMRSILKYLILNLYNIYPAAIRELEELNLNELTFNLRNIKIFNFNFKLLTKIRYTFLLYVFII